MLEVWAPPGPCTWLSVCGRCREYDMHNDCQKDYKCANYQGNHGAGSRDCEVWKKEKDYQTKTYSKHHLPRRMVETTKYADMTRYILPQQPKNKAIICVKQVQPQNLR